MLEITHLDIDYQGRLILSDVLNTLNRRNFCSKSYLANVVAKCSWLQLIGGPPLSEKLDWLVSGKQLLASHFLGYGETRRPCAGTTEAAARHCYVNSTLQCLEMHNAKPDGN